MNSDVEASVSKSQAIIVRHRRNGGRYVKAIALILLSVLSGAVIGVGTTVLYFRKMMHRVPPRADAIAESMLSAMHRRLSVTPEEAERLRAVIDRDMREVEGIRQGSVRDMRKVFDRMHGDIVVILGSERAAVWEEYRKPHFSGRRHQGDRECVGPGRGRWGGWLHRDG